MSAKNVFIQVIEKPKRKVLIKRGITDIWDSEKKYDPSFIGYTWDDKNPRIQLEPRGERGYIELVALNTFIESY